MPKNKRRSGSKAARPAATPARLATPVLSSDLRAGLSQAEALMTQKRWAEARAVLDPLAARFRNSDPLLTDLLNVCYELQDWPGYLKALRPLLQLRPDDPDLHLALGGAYLNNLHLALALRAFRAFLARWPDHPRAADARRQIGEIEQMARTIWREAGVSDDQAEEMSALNEEVLLLQALRDWAQARQVGERLVRVYPEFLSGLNNLSAIYAFEGRLDQAIALAERVLAAEPANFHALGNLIRFFFLTGRVGDAVETAVRLKATDSASGDIWSKKAEALSYLGDDAGVLEAFAGGERAGVLKMPQGGSLLYHFAAVAALRTGHEGTARRYWQQALKLVPDFDLAQANLDDLRKPVAERHAPWPYVLNNWLTQTSGADLRRLAGQATGARVDGAVTAAVRRHLERHAEFAALIPILLDRGDPGGRELAFRTAKMVATPDMLAALHDFALSRRGPDALRIEAAQVVSNAGLLPDNPVRLWIAGDWRDIQLMNFDINTEPEGEHTPAVDDLLSAALDALRGGDGTRAEPLLHRALALEPDAPDLLNNLAAAYQLQGRTAESRQLLRDLHERHPDYIFAAVSLARLAIQDKRIAEARELLQPLFARRTLHIQEYVALCQAEIEFQWAEGRPDGAQSWVDMLARVDPDNPVVIEWRRRLNNPLLRRLLR